FPIRIRYQAPLGCRRVMHYLRVVLTRKDITGATHIRDELINFVKAAVDDQAAKILAAQIANYKITSASVSENSGNLRSTPRTHNSSRLRLTDCPPMNPPAPQTTRISPLSLLLHPEALP